MDRNRNAKVIIPLAVVAWLLAIAVFRDGVPALFRGLYVAAFAIIVPCVVFYLIADTGWRALAARHRQTLPFRGPWRACATGQMARVSVSHPDFERMKMRWVGGTLRVGATAEALYLSTPVSSLPGLRSLFPTLQIPWASVAAARAFEAPGWFRPPQESGALLQAAYDPGYTGKFVEIEVGSPPVFIQLPADVLGDAIARLPLSGEASGAQR